jgi:hypothetical protein
MMPPRGDVERFADGEQSDGERRDLDAVEQFGNAEGERGWPVSLSMPTRPSVRPMNSDWSGRAAANRRRSPRR